MTVLSGIDRPRRSIPYEPWGRDIIFVPLSAVQLCELNDHHPDMQGVDGDNKTQKLLGFFAELLSLCVVEPVAAKEEWLSEVRGSTVMDLGKIVAQASGIWAEDEDTEKN